MTAWDAIMPSIVVGCILMVVGFYLAFTRKDERDDGRRK